MGGLLLVILDIPQEKAHEVVSHERSYRRRLEHGDLGSLITTEVKSTCARPTALSAVTRPLLALAFRKDDMLAGEPTGLATSRTMTRASSHQSPRSHQNHKKMEET